MIVVRIKLPIGLKVYERGALGTIRLAIGVLICTLKAIEWYTPLLGCLLIVERGRLHIVAQVFQISDSMKLNNAVAHSFRCYLVHGKVDKDFVFDALLSALKSCPFLAKGPLIKLEGVVFIADHILKRAVHLAILTGVLQRVLLRKNQSTRMLLPLHALLFAIQIALFAL